MLGLEVYLLGKWLSGCLIPIFNVFVVDRKTGQRLQQAAIKLDLRLDSIFCVDPIVGSSAVEQQRLLAPIRLCSWQRYGAVHGHENP